MAGVALLLDSPSVGPLPVPTRMEMLTARMSFQGETASTSLGTYPWWDLPLDTLTPTDRQSVYAMKHGERDQVMLMAVSHAYNEPDIPAEIGAGRDWFKEGYAGLAVLIDEVIAAGFYVQLHLAGDGQSVNDESIPDWEYNDPVGWTYGYAWLMEQFPFIAAAMGHRNQFIRYVPGFDAVFYGWSPEQVVAFGKLFRSVLPDGYLGIEHDPGHIPVGEGGSDYQPNGRMQDYDFILGEFPGDGIVSGDTWWQILGRMVSPYVRPPDQPSWDDPNPPFYLGSPSPRGPFVYWAFEWKTYRWVRRLATRADVDADRVKIRAMGCQLVA